MNKQQELAQKLNGRECGNEITDEECKQAKECGLIVVFGSSDDLCELRGAFHEELDSYKGTTVYSERGKFKKPVDERDLEECPHCGEVCPHCSMTTEGKFWIKQEWCPIDHGGSWHFTTNIPNVAEFRIYEEDGEYYGNGLVISVEDLK